jgi:hypothetical protein
MLIHGRFECRSAGQKSSWLSRRARCVIAGHSPERILATGLLMEASEKNPPDDREVAL